MNQEFVARYCNTTLKRGSFTEIGDALIDKGFNMSAAYAKDDGVLVVPHTRTPRVTATLFASLGHVEESVKEPIPTRLDLANATLAGAAVMDGFEDGAKVAARDCGAVHPDGMVCILPVFAERLCCSERVFPHDGPHQVHGDDGVITHRWVEELIIRDLPFNTYGAMEMSS
jgi:hypothetical protein